MGHDKRKGKEPMVEPPKKKKTRTQKEAERAAMAARAAAEQAPITGVGSRFTSLEPGPRSNRVSESVHLRIGRFVSVRGLEEGTLSVKIRVQGSRRTGPVALTPLHRIVLRTVRSRLLCTGWTLLSELPRVLICRT
jgi:hypothetical protein